MRERCMNCGWTGTEEGKLHYGIAGMKGPGFCPDCASDEFEEIAICFIEEADDASAL